MDTERLHTCLFVFLVLLVLPVISVLLVSSMLLILSISLWWCGTSLLCCCWHYVRGSFRRRSVSVAVTRSCRPTLESMEKSNQSSRCRANSTLRRRESRARRSLY